MPAGSEKKRKWWARRSRLEKILFGIVLITVILILTLLVLAIKSPNKCTETSETCDTPTCLTEASTILQYVDPDVDPCDNFYQFACGSFLKRAHGDERLDLLHTLKEQSKRELLEAYLDPIQDTDHKMVKTVKKLFRACMNKEMIERDKFSAINRAIKAVGGWPVVDVRSWNSTNFDWLNATYTLRKLGYYYMAFLELTVEPDPDNSTQFIFKVAMPFMWDYSSQSFDKVKFMTDVAIQFRAPPPDEAIVESMKSVDQFLTQLQLEAHSRYYMGDHKKYTVEQYQQLYGVIDWLQFINNIAGHTASISKTDFVLFPPPETLRRWLSLITRTPKRTQANYMIWKMIEQAIPFLPDGVQNHNLRNRKDETRQEFCLREIQERFLPSPADIMCDRKYLPPEKKEKVEQFASNIKSELVKALESIKWIDENDKQKIMNKAKTMRMIIGQPEDYFSDKILDNLDVDMVDSKSNSFVELMTQVTRNRQTTLYNQIKSPSNVYEKWYIQDASALPIYDEKDNVLYIPTVVTESQVYRENRPQYLNYGTMGTQLGHQFSNILLDHLRGVDNGEEWSNRTKQEAAKKIKCLQDGLEEYSSKTNQLETTNMMHLKFGEELSYSAYENWVKSQGDELRLISTKYTPKQLFWISLGSLFCQPFNEFSVMNVHEDEQHYGKIISGLVRMHPQFAKDFQCPVGSRMSSSKGCFIFNN